MRNVNTRISKWAKESDLLAKVIRDERFNKLIDDAFCDNQEKRTVASLKLYDLLWGTHFELGPCPDVERLSRFEYDRAFFSNYRDHVSHAIKTFFLGVYLYEKNTAIKENIDLRLKHLGLSDVENIFVLIWTVTSLFHDIGYLLENDKIHYDNDLKQGFLDSINERLALPLSNTHSFSREVTGRESNFINKHEIFTPTISSISQLEDEDQFPILLGYSQISGLSKANSPKNGIKEYYLYAKSHRPSPERFPYNDHGIAGALILLKTWFAYATYLEKIITFDYQEINGDVNFIDKLQNVYQKLPNTKIAIIEAAGAMALHNIRKDCWDTKETLYTGMELDVFSIKLIGDNRLPFAFLLKMTDVLQCWDRQKYSMPDENSISLTGDDIDIYTKNSTICIWIKDDERFSSPETDKDSKYHKLVSELARYLDIEALTFSFNVNDEENADRHQGNEESLISYLKSIIAEYDEIAKIYSSKIKAVEKSDAFANLVRPDAVIFVSRTFQVPQAYSHLLSHTFEVPQDPIQVEGFDDIFDYFTEYKRVALTGDPGSGKSTTLGFTAYKFATMCLEGKMDLIPVLIDLGGMSGEQVEDYLTAHIDERLPNIINTDRLLLLLDGFNEISAKDAEKLKEWIADKSNQSLIITCRRGDYIERQLPLRRIDIEPLDLMQIWEMIGKYLIDEYRDKLFWSLAGPEVEKAWIYFTERYIGPEPFKSFWQDDIGPVHSFESVKFAISVLQKDLREQKKMPGMLPLLSNPFLLYAAIILYYNNQEAPHSRQEVLTGFAIAILGKAGIHSQLLQEGTHRRIRADLIRKSSSLANDPGNWIAYCAFRMFERGGGTAVPLDWLRKELETRFKSESAKRFIDELITGNLLERFGPNKQLVKFKYQLMQEFFAAVHLCVKSNFHELHKIFEEENWWEPSTWDETIRITAELLHDATELIQALYMYKPELAYSCIREGVCCQEDVYQELLNPSKIETPVSPRARAAWGESLVADNGIDSRKGVGLTNKLPEFEWIYVKGGQIDVGIDGGDGATMGVAGKTRNVKLDYDFYISKYPVTRVQFNAFLQDGYEDRQNWSDLGWRWKGTRSCPELWDNSDYSINNAPVVGVSWFEAMAFCRWVSRKLAKEGWEIDLPLEAEWEHAARFPDGRTFPWGNDYIPGYANIDESAEGVACGPFSLGKPTSVGIYSKGLSELEIADLCGNVWEWCKSRWDVRYEWPEVTCSEKVDHRVIKGGSWYNSIRFASSGIHDCLDADLGVNDVGFRVIMRKIYENSQAVQMTQNSTSHTVRKILVLGMADSGRTEFVRSVGDFPLQVVHKKDFSSGIQIQMDYGRQFHNNWMHYFYAPVVADDKNFSRFINEMQGVIFILSGCKEHSQFNKESLFSISELCKGHGIPLLVGVSGFDLGGFSLKRSLIEDLQYFGVTVSSFSAIDRSSCTDLLDVLFKDQK